MNDCSKQQCEHYRKANPQYKERERCAMAPYKVIAWGNPNKCREHRREGR